MKPLILVTPATDGKSLTLNKAYTNACVAAGGIPVIPPYDNDNLEYLAEMSDGILFSGGGDIHASYFKDELHPKAGSIAVDRDEFEVRLCCRAIELRKPIFCICRGMQLLNVALGGNIIQDMPDHVQTEPRDAATHKVNVIKDSLLHSIMRNEKICVNSFHHQAVGSLGAGIVVSAVSQDGYTEAIELKGYPFALGVQWHPEAMAVWGNSTEKNPHYRLFTRFISEAAKRNGV